MTTIAVYNRKGGVGKTTTAVNLLAGIARRAHRPLDIFRYAPDSRGADDDQALVDELVGGGLLQ